MRRLCVAFALVTLAGCGGEQLSEKRDAQDDPPAAATPAPQAPPVGSGGAAAPPAPDRIGRRLGKLCARVQAELRNVPEPDGPGGAADNAETEIAVLDALWEVLGAFEIDARRRDALQEYRATLRHEIAVDRLIITAATAGDQPAIDDLNEQNAHNRRKRAQLAEEALEAERCRPGRTITD
jgi:hypothetical protein